MAQKRISRFPLNEKYSRLSGHVPNYAIYQLMQQLIATVPYLQYQFLQQRLATVYSLFTSFCSSCQLLSTPYLAASCILSLSALSISPIYICIRSRRKFNTTRPPSPALLSAGHLSWKMLQFLTSCMLILCLTSLLINVIIHVDQRLIHGIYSAHHIQKGMECSSIVAANTYCNRFELRHPWQKKKPRHTRMSDF